MGKWEKLSSDLLLQIEKRLVLYIDKVHFSAVCESWRSVLPHLPDHRQFQPWLLLPPCDESNQSSHALLNVLDNKTYHVQLDLKAQEMIYRGSSCGWVISLERAHMICLRNPLTNAKIELPPRSKFPDIEDFCPDNVGNEYITRDRSTGRLFTLTATNVMQDLTQKIILSASPGVTEDYVAVAIYGEFRKLAYCKQGDEKWTFLYGGELFIDAIFYKRKLYAVSLHGDVFHIDVRPNPRLKKLASGIIEQLLPTDSHLRYLVKSCIGLLFIERVVFNDWSEENFGKYRTLRFNVYKLVRKRLQWQRVTDIGGDVVFIGYNTSVAKSSREFSGSIRGNSIYFTDDNITNHHEGRIGGADMGVFGLESGRIEPLPGFKSHRDVVWPPPVWVIPTP